MRTHILKFRVNLLEKRIIQQKSKQAGQSVSMYLRHCALGKELRPRLTEQELTVYLNLSEMKSHFSRISNLIRNRLDIATDVRRAIEILNQHLRKFQ